MRNDHAVPRAGFDAVFRNTGQFQQDRIGIA